MKFKEVRELLNTDWFWMVESDTGNFEEIDFSIHPKSRLDRYMDAIIEKITPGDNYLEITVREVPKK